MRERNIGIQALWGLTTVAKQPDGKAAGALKPSHIQELTGENLHQWINLQVKIYIYGGSIDGKNFSV